MKAFIRFGIFVQTDISVQTKRVTFHYTSTRIFKIIHNKTDSLETFSEEKMIFPLRKSQFGSYDYNDKRNVYFYLKL